MKARGARLAAVALLVAAPLAAARSGDAERHAITSGGRERVYWLHEPPSLSADRPAPLVLACREPDATRAIWEFFRDHPRRTP